MPQQHKRETKLQGQKREKKKEKRENCVQSRKVPLKINPGGLGLFGLFVREGQRRTGYSRPKKTFLGGNQNARRIKKYQFTF